MRKKIVLKTIKKKKKKKKERKHVSTIQRRGLLSEQFFEEMSLSREGLGKYFSQSKGEMKKKIIHDYIYIW